MCVKFGSEIYGINNSLKVGIALNTLHHMPIHAVRHNEENGTNGWYIWGGEYSESPDFYQPLCAEHLVDYCPHIIKYLALAPGYRLIIDNEGYEDVWYDPEVTA
ncbi:hypothetical protein EOL70_16560 [Leucothrix sargassi]|nr:hypothetical protein EOL70_16560 [Leucothrix sargassi]